MKRLIAIILLHAAGLAALTVITLPGLVVFATLVVATGLFGFSLGFHRLLAHRTFKAPRIVELTLVLLGCLGLQTGPVTWVAIHRFHHGHADKDEDPHTPLVSLFWSHLVWALFDMPGLANPDFRRRYAPEVSSDPAYVFLEKHLYVLNALLGLGLLFAGMAAGGVHLGISLLLWGFAARIVYVWHLTALIASACHRWGYRNYNTTDNSRNLWWVSLVGFGEGWHNNHHAYPRRVNFSTRWQEVDPAYWVFWCLEKARLATRFESSSREGKGHLGVYGNNRLRPRREDRPDHAESAREAQRDK
jgi:stearoyl-CoA desaturase (delta-9 desaturase)